ncbi:MAG TPA: hypothetical protein VGE04_03395 [Chloroflexia bacterium]
MREGAKTGSGAELVGTGAAVAVIEGRAAAGVGDAGAASVRQPDNTDVSSRSRSRQMPAGVRERVVGILGGVVEVMIR